MEAPEYSEDKFTELLLYVAEETADDESFGATKLNKVLFFADFISYAVDGKPITGAVYQKLRYGPAPRRLLPVVQRLQREDAALRESRFYLGQKQKRLVALRGPDLSAFTKDELALVNGIIKSLRGRSAVQVSQLSHQASVGWQFAEVGEDIPYFTAFLANPEPPTTEDVARAKELAEKYEWLPA